MEVRKKKPRGFKFKPPGPPTAFSLLPGRSGQLRAAPGRCGRLRAAPRGFGPPLRAAPGRSGPMIPSVSASPTWGSVALSLQK